jgi:hypothetical protein
MMRHIFGWIAFVAGLFSLPLVAYLFIAVRAGSVNYFPNSWVWPFFAVGILFSILLLETGRALLSLRLLLAIEVIAILAVVLWYGLSALI